MSCFIYSTAPTVDFTTRYQHEKLSCQWKAQHHKSGEALSTSHLGQLKSHRVETASQTCQTGKIILSKFHQPFFYHFSFITLTIDVLILIPARSAIYFFSRGQVRWRDLTDKQRCNKTSKGMSIFRFSHHARSVPLNFGAN